MNKQQFVKIIVGLCEMYDREATEFVINTYYEIFKSYELGRFSNAVTECIKTHKYNSLPKPAEILDKLNGNSAEIKSNHSAYIEYKENEFEEPTKEQKADIDRLIQDCLSNIW